MSDLTLTKTRLIAGVWEGQLTSEGALETAPAISVTHDDQPVEGVEVIAEGEATWLVRIPVPSATLSDGVQAFLITDPATSTVIGTFTIMAGEIVEDDLRSEVELLRSELDMLKRAFRRHCVETM